MPAKLQAVAHLVAAGAVHQTQAGILAAEIVGFPKLRRDKHGDIVPGSLQATGKNGLIGYLTFVALNEPRAYLGFLGRLLPLQINAHFDGQVDHNRELTPEELREELRRRGLPDHIFDPPPQIPGFGDERKSNPDGNGNKSSLT